MSTAAPLLDQFQRRITYLRLSVTDRCNLRCTHCMIEGTMKQLVPTDGADFDAVLRITPDDPTAHFNRGAALLRLMGAQPAAPLPMATGIVVTRGMVGSCCRAAQRSYRRET
mgnify:CR=1 FL=1